MAYQCKIFRKYYEMLVQPHLDSYNEVIKDGLSLMVESLPSLELPCPSGEKLSLIIDEAQIGMAGKIESIMKGDVGNNDCYPSECRIRHISYTSTMKISWTISNGGVILCQSIKRVGEIPIMVGSILCKLENLTSSKLIFHGEDSQEFGGYFIVNGLEKLIRLLLVQRRNHPLALFRQTWRQRGEIFTSKGVSIRCVSRDYSECIMILHYLNNGSCTLSIKPHGGQILYIPLIYILKSLIDVTDYEIFREIMASNPKDSFLEGCIIAMLRGSLMQGLTSKSDILRYLGRKYRGKSRFSASFSSDFEMGELFISECICIHLQQPRDKFFLLVEICIKLYSLVQDKIAPDNPDSPMFQEVLLPGSIYISVLRSALIAWMSHFRNDLEKQLYLHPSNNLLGVLEQMKHSESSALISGRMNYFIATGNISRDVYGIPQFKGLTIIAERLNFHRFLSHFRSIHRGHFFTELRTTTVRKLLPDAWGFFCPVNTPDGSPCGLLNHLAANCRVTTEHHNTDLKTILMKMGMSDIYEIIRLDKLGKFQESVLKVMVDGKIIGFCGYDIGYNIVNDLRRSKVLVGSSVPNCLEIVCPIMQQNSAFPGIFLFTTPGRLMRPLLNKVENCLEIIGSFEQVFPALDIQSKHSKLDLQTFAAKI